VDNFERLVRVAMKLQVRRDQHWDRIRDLLNRYPHGHYLWALNYADYPIEYEVIHEDRTGHGFVPTYSITIATRRKQVPDVTPEGQELFRLDRFIVTLNTRRNALKRVKDRLLKGLDLDD
jgi:hypothetical protein